MNVRSPAVAGTFYEKSPDKLQAQMQLWLDSGRMHAEPLRAVIVPHAGYVYSGQVAGEAFSYLHAQSEQIHRVILIGPSHRFSFPGCDIPAADFFSTPLGLIQIDKQSFTRITPSPDVEISDQVHAFEHSLEVQLPFLQTCLKQFSLVPLLVGSIAPQVLAGLIESLWQDEQTLLVVSSDLSHYHPDDEARKIDLSTCYQIEQCEPTLTPEQACGATGINALLLLVKKRGYHIRRIALKNSSDTIGDKQRVVGYVSYLISEA
ncbi:AmmeMemoRadiSam system protein B [Vibrio quintilis]|uniref:MEMO1 family protein VQ7734_03942 n=1 Tax=Vibrio quintilis TaxID=1117707 RepID=A0A1M7Z033_9VIBR|nr:AmmeMemoRadiSam system protein B [Vibrio quintilis]SHO58172.1 hypothetical protein VQ7734_03942 [Vibrio quintilis]